MIRHVVLANFKPEIEYEQGMQTIKSMGEALSKIPGVKNLIVGQGIALTGRIAFTNATIMDFDDKEQLRTYLDHPKHVELKARRQAICSDILVLDFSY